MNIIGVRSMIQLARKLPNLVSFVHISTAYANCNRDTIDEEIYDPPLSPAQLISAVRWVK